MKSETEVWTRKQTGNVVDIRAENLTQKISEKSLVELDFLGFNPPDMQTNRTSNQIFLSIIHPFHVRRLKRNIRAWIGKAVKDPQSVEAEFVFKWSKELREIYGL